MNQKIEFGHRLHEGMRAVGLEPKPSVLLNLFNARYWGTSVSFQAVSRWLNGPAMLYPILLNHCPKFVPATKSLLFSQPIARYVAPT